MKKMKKPYSSIKAICTIAMILLMQTSFAQEVDTQQQTSGTEKSESNAVEQQMQTRAAVDNGIGASQMATIHPFSPNSVFQTEKSYNVDMSTGRLSVQVPIATVGPQEIPIPVALSYTTGGVKLRDVASWVGLGWNLSAGGKITRVKQKYADRLDGSMISFLDSTTWTCKVGDKKGNFDDRVKNEDTQPDLFSFEIPGKSGLFVLDPWGNASTIPYQNVQINYDKTTNFFEIIDDAGNRYYFENSEITHMFMEPSSFNDKLNGMYATTWNLTSISNIKGEFVNFEYKNLDPTTPYKYTSYAKSLTIDSNNVVDSITTAKYDIITSPLYLSKISWSTGSVEFSSSTGRLDIPKAAYKLDAIKLYGGNEGNKLIKTYKFEYSAFVNKSLKLDRINVSTPKSTGSEFFRKFEYITDYNLPHIIPDSTNYYALDDWGYYNGKTANKYGIPSFFIKNVSGNAGLGRQYDDKYTSPAHAMANSLKRVWVTSSGYEEFEYEGNEYQIVGDPFPARAGGVRVKSITTKSTELGNVTQKVRYEYKDDNGRSSGVLFNLPRYDRLASQVDIPSENFHLKYYVVTDSPVSSVVDLDGSHIRYSKVRELFDNGSSNTYFFTTKSDQPDAGYTGVRSIRNPSEVITYHMMVNENKDSAPVNTRFWKRGLLKEKISKDATGKETYRETYEYNLNAPIKKTIKGVYPFVYISKHDGSESEWVDTPYLVSYNYISQPFYVTKTTVTGTNIPKTESVYEYDDKDYNDTDLDHILLKKQTVQSGADKYATTYKYPFDYTNISGTESGNAIQFMRKQNIASAPIEIVKYKNDQIIGGELYIYGTWHYMSNGSITGAMFNLCEVKELLLKKPKLIRDFAASIFVPYQSGYKFTFDNSYVTKATYGYNYSNKLSCVKEKNKPNQSTIYDDSRTLPIAQITNAEVKVVSGNYYEEALHTSFEGTNGRPHSRAKTGFKVQSGSYIVSTKYLVPGSYSVSYWVSYNDGVGWELYEHELEVEENQNREFAIGGNDCIIDELRIHKKNAIMQTKTYDLNQSVISETDANGKTTYYEYDAFGRLITVMDNNREKIKSYDYYIK